MTYILSPSNGVLSEGNTTTTNIGGQTTLNEGGELSSIDTTITVTDGTVFSDGQTIKIDSEYIIIGTVSTNDLTGCTRGAFDSDADTHADGSTIIGLFIGASEQNTQPDAMISLKSDTSGTLYVDFSNDDTNWDTFPVLGFNVTANIHEFHIVVKGNRYIRIRFENGSTSATTDIRIYTYYGVFRQGNLPLNQSISSDADSTIVRSVNAAQEPSGNYTNIKKDGSAYKTTSNLQGTTLNSTLTSETTGNINLTSTTNFGSSGYIYIGSEYIGYSAVVDGTTITISSRGNFGSTAAAHSISDVVGEVYDSGLLTLEGYIEVATKILCSNTGIMKFIWYSDSSGTDIIRNLSPSYSSVDTYDYLAAPNFGSYARYLFANTESSATTDFYYETEFYTKSISAQVLTINSDIFDTMTSNLTRSIQIGKNPENTFENSRQDGYAFYTTTPLSSDGTYVSSVIDNLGYSQAQIEISSDQSGSMTGAWYSDSAGTKLVRNFILPYTTSGDTDLPNIIPNTFPVISRYIKFTYTNGSTGQSSFLFSYKLLTKSISGQTLGVEDVIVPSMISNLSRNVNTGKQPDGDYVNVPADGEAFNTESVLSRTTLNEGAELSDSDTTITLTSVTGFPTSGFICIDEELIEYTGISTNNLTGCTRGSSGTTAIAHDDGSTVKEVYVSSFYDTDGWNIIECFIATNQTSKIRGFILEFTDDVQSAPPTIRGREYYSYNEQDVIKGYEAISIQPKLDGFRVIYIDGDTAHTSFYLSTTLKVNSSPNRYNVGRALVVGDFLTEVALSNVSNYEYGYKFGRNGVINTGTAEDVWENGGTYTGQPVSYTPDTVEILSSSVNDTSAGSGARTVRISGLKSSTSSSYTSEDLTLNGTTAVTSSNSWWRINRAYVLTAGTGGENAGTLTVRGSLDNAVIFLTISAGRNQSNVACYTVPANREILIKQLKISITRASGAAGSALLSIRARIPNGVYRSIETYDLQTGPAIIENRAGGIVFSAGSDIKIKCDSVSDNGTIVNASFEYILLRR